MSEPKRLLEGLIHVDKWDFVLVLRSVEKIDGVASNRNTLSADLRHVEVLHHYTVSGEVGRSTKRKVIVLRDDPSRLLHQQLRGVHDR